VIDAQIVAIDSVRFRGEWRNTAYTADSAAFVFEGDRTHARAQADRSELVAVLQRADHYRWERPGHFVLDDPSGAPGVGDYGQLEARRINEILRLKGYSGWEITEWWKTASPELDDQTPLQVWLHEESPSNETMAAVRRAAEAAPPKTAP
jgi:hypothetical protein